MRFFVTIGLVLTAGIFASTSVPIEPAEGNNDVDSSGVAASLARALSRAGHEDDRYWDDRFFSPQPPRITFVAVDPGGLVFVGGDFAEIGGALASGFAVWDGETWSAAPDGYVPASGSVDSRFRDGHGNVYVGGTEFASPGPRYLARYQAFGGGWAIYRGLPEEPVKSVATTSDDILYVGGGRQLCNKYECWVSELGLRAFEDGKWVQPSTELPIIEKLAAGRAGELYAFGSKGLREVRAVYRWNGNTWTRVGDLTGGTLYHLLARGDGTLIVSGRFAIGGVEYTGLAQWTGSEWKVIRTDPAHTLLQRLHGDLIVGVLDEEGLRVERWNGAGWDILFEDPETLGGPLVALDVDPQGRVYVAGDPPYSTSNVGFHRMRTSAGTENFARIVDGSWENIVPGGLGLYDGRNALTTTGGATQLLINADGDVVALGNFSQAGTAATNGLAVWDGSGWTAIERPDGLATIGTDEAGKLYGAGRMVIDGTDYLLATYDEGSWTGFVAVGDYPFEGLDADIERFVVDESGKIYMAVRTYEDAPWPWFVWKETRLVSFDGQEWTSLGPPNPGGDVRGVKSMILDDRGGLYLGGDISAVGGNTARGVAYWNGAEWSSLGSGLYSQYYRSEDGGKVRSMVLVGGLLYVGGTFDEAGGMPASNIASWDGSEWQSLEDGCSHEVYVLIGDRDGNVYAAGNFWWAGDEPAYKIAKWDGLEWGVLGSGVTSGSVIALAFDRDNALVLSGAIGRAGGKPASGIARWLKTGGYIESPVDTTTSGGPVVSNLTVSPNPVSGEAVVQFATREAILAKVVVYDVLGRTVANVFEGNMAVGDHRFSVTANAWSSGVYLVTVVSGGKHLGARTVVVVR